jgi:hypothetical protein
MSSSVSVSCRDCLIANCDWNRVESDLESFNIAVTPVCHSHFGFRHVFLFGVIHEYSTFYGLYWRRIRIFISINRVSVWLWDICFIFSCSSQEISATWLMSDFFEGMLFQTWALFTTRLPNSCEFRNLRDSQISKQLKNSFNIHKSHSKTSIHISARWLRLTFKILWYVCRHENTKM